MVTVKKLRLAKASANCLSKKSEITHPAGGWLAGWINWEKSNLSSTKVEVEARAELGNYQTFLASLRGKGGYPSLKHKTFSVFFLMKASIILR